MLTTGLASQLSLNTQDLVGIRQYSNTLIRQGLISPALRRPSQHPLPSQNWLPPHSVLRQKIAGKRQQRGKGSVRQLVSPSSPPEHQTFEHSRLWVLSPQHKCSQRYDFMFAFHDIALCLSCNYNLATRKMTSFHLFLDWVRIWSSFLISLL